MTISELAELCEGTLLRGDPARMVRGVSIDSRTIKKDHLFLALKGDRFDGHDFAATAIGKGAAGIIGQHQKLAGLADRFDRRACLIEVGDPLAALHLFARRYRSKFDISLVVVAGSCGKTTTKDMLAAILGQTQKTVKTAGNLNNLIGAPLMLLQIGLDTESAVIEIASNAPGEIEQLARIISPTAAILTNIGPVHLEGLGSVEGVLREKSSLVPHIRSGGFVVIDKETVPPDRIGSMFSGRIITFGLKESADFFATGVRQDIKAGAEFLLNDRDRIRIPLLGTHNVLNALAAIAAAAQLGASIDSITRGLEHFSATSMRMETVEYRDATIINDAYNANPIAMRESISTIMSIPAERILALGDMLELGEHSREAHRSLGQYTGQIRPDLLYLCGDFSEEVRDGALTAGMQAERIYCCADVDEIAISLKHILRPGDLLLVKGSRGMRMERVVQRLLEES